MTNDTKKTEVEDAFKKLNVPNQKDFSKLIDFCDKGNQILSNLQDGLTIKDGKLAVNLDENSGLKSQDNVLTLKVSNGLQISPENSIEVCFAPNSGLTAKNPNGLSVYVGDGFEDLSTTKGELKLKLAQKSGLKCDANGLQLSLDKINGGSGLQITPDGYLKIKCGKGFKIEDNSLTLDLSAFED